MRRCEECEHLSSLMAHGPIHGSCTCDEEEYERGKTISRERLLVLEILAISALASAEALDRLPDPTGALGMEYSRIGDEFSVAFDMEVILKLIAMAKSSLTKIPVDTMS